MRAEKSIAVAVVLGSMASMETSLAAQMAAFRRGDANADGLFNITDPVLTLNALFRVTGISDGGATGPDFATIKYDP